MRKLRHDMVSMSDRLNSMQPEAKEHFMQLVDLLLLCYTEPPQARAVLLVEPEDGDHLAIASANASEIDVVELIREATAAMSHVVVADAPPKDLFN